MTTNVMDQAAQRLDLAVAAIQSLPAESRDIVVEYARALEDLNAEALKVLVKRVRESSEGREAVARALEEDERVRMLLAMYGVIRAPRVNLDLAVQSGCCGGGPGGGDGCGCS